MATKEYERPAAPKAPAGPIAQEIELEAKAAAEREAAEAKALAAAQERGALEARLAAAERLAQEAFANRNQPQVIYAQPEQAARGSSQFGR